VELLAGLCFVVFGHKGFHHEFFFTMCEGTLRKLKFLRCRGTNNIRYFPNSYKSLFCTSLGNSLRLTNPDHQFSEFTGPFY